MTDTNWIHEGAKVAEFWQRYTSAHVNLATIARLTNTQIVLDNTNRYNRDNQTKVGDRYAAKLLPVSDPQVRNVLANRCVDSLASRVDKLARDHRNGPGGVSAALAVLNEIERAVQAARQAIADGGSRS